jgi:hypothetical protein
LYWPPCVQYQLLCLKAFLFAETVVMPNPICEKCKPVEVDNKEDIGKEKGCEKLYEVVDDCMKRNSGNVASCRVEWEQFTKCFKAPVNK